MRELATHETENEYARLWRLEDDRVLFVTHLTPESATRYQFEIIDAEEKQCVYAKGAGTTPPRVVVELLNEHGFTATNLPNITEDDPAMRANQIGDAIGWLSKHGGFEPGDLRKFAYQRAHNVMPTIYASELVIDVIGSERFTDHLEGVLNDAALNGVSLTPDELLDPRTHNIELLQHIIVEIRRSLPMEDQERVTELAEERYGMVASGDQDDVRGTSWDTKTQEEETIQLHPEATERLSEEGWLSDDWT